jgi:hypothetical protein
MFCLASVGTTRVAAKHHYLLGNATGPEWRTFVQSISRPRPTRPGVSLYHDGPYTCDAPIIRKLAVDYGKMPLVPAIITCVRTAPTAAARPPRPDVRAGPRRGLLEGAGAVDGRGGGAAGGGNATAGGLAVNMKALWQDLADTPWHQFEAKARKARRWTTSSWSGQSGRRGGGQGHVWCVCRPVARPPRSRGRPRSGEVGGNPCRRRTSRGTLWPRPSGPGG